MNEHVYDLSEGWNSLAADLLYASMDDGVPAEELAFYERRIRENGGIALDQACGTGRHIFPLLERGLDVHGADISADALQLARKAAETHGVQLTLYHQSMEECDIPHKYGTIYVANATFQVIADRQQAIQVLERFCRHLSPGGQLLVELWVPLEEIGGAKTNDTAEPTRWEPVPRVGARGEIGATLWSESLDPFEQTLVSKRRYDLFIDDQCVRSEVHAHVLRWYYKYEFIMMLERAGFVDITTYSSYTDQPATKESQAVVYGARRPQPNAIRGAIP